MVARRWAGFEMTLKLSNFANTKINKTPLLHRKLPSYLPQSSRKREEEHQNPKENVIKSRHYQQSDGKSWRLPVFPPLISL
jgi:hypothetical protein